jgi:hypothetical protein
VTEKIKRVLDDTRFYAKTRFSSHEENFQNGRLYSCIGEAAAVMLPPELLMKEMLAGT